MCGVYTVYICICADSYLIYYITAYERRLGLMRPVRRSVLIMRRLKIRLTLFSTARGRFASRPSRARIVPLALILIKRGARGRQLTNELHGARRR